MSYLENTSLFLDSTESSLNLTSNGPLFPSGFSLAHIVCACVVISVIILAIVLGNFLVIVAIFADNNLNQPQNWFIASLAVSDLLLGLLIMPLSLGNEVTGYWPFGDVLCTLWLVTDVLLCTASILNLCLISIDRYRSITDVTYARRRTTRQSQAFIAIVWLLSMVICLPPLVGWKRPQPVTLGYPKCVLSQEVGYIIYSTLGSFYLPLTVMVVVYFKIYMAARSLARRAVKNKGLKTTMPDTGTNGTKPAKTALLNAQYTSNVKHATNKGDHLCTSSEDESGELQLQRQKAIMSSCSPQRDHREMATLLVKAVNSTRSNTPIPTEDADYQSLNSGGNSPHDHLAPPLNNEVTISPDVASEMTKSVSLKDDKQNPYHFRRKVARARERRATVVLGVIMTTFVICWLPFFSTYLISSLAGLHVHNMIFSVFFWFGYCNSALNPLIYTIFNREFRQAFQKLLFRRKNRFKASRTYV